MTSEPPNSDLCVAEGNQSGPLCTLCEGPSATSLGSFFDVDEARCVECPVPSDQIGTIAAIVSGILCALLRDQALACVPRLQHPNDIAKLKPNDRVVRRGRLAPAGE